MFTLRRFFLLLSHHFHCLKPSCIWVSPSYAGTPIPAGCRGKVLYPRACEGFSCRGKAGFVALKVITVVGCRVKQWHVLRKLAYCPYAFSCWHSPLECQAGWNTQPRARAGQGGTFKAFPTSVWRQLMYEMVICCLLKVCILPLALALDRTVHSLHILQVWISRVVLPGIKSSAQWCCFAFLWHYSSSVAQFALLATTTTHLVMSTQ